jgi:hypothetical protein
MLCAILAVVALATTCSMLVAILARSKRASQDGTLDVPPWINEPTDHDKEVK